ncbi:hypothetical protein CDCA_CDCA02G0750 [Cyanidium caldarium]|uniref:Phosphoribulokinase, chloroplastic n=1 Tax=Cyanidium caldarium TaxID=2771 RepID=A0AAV9IQY5_CYACA|nr:hypothetical protein CDCA_CDCA02G0750 [Cyanidium caldarium]
MAFIVAGVTRAATLQVNGPHRSKTNSCGQSLTGRRSAFVAGAARSSWTSAWARPALVHPAPRPLSVPSQQRRSVTGLSMQIAKMQKARNADNAPRGVHTAASVGSVTSEAMRKKSITRPVIVAVAADSGAGKSTFLRRVQRMFGTEVPKGHTPQGELMTVICLDDWHNRDRQGRKVDQITALDENCQNFELMAEQLEALKEGRDIMKPIYNHDTGNIDPPELIQPNHIIVIEGLHPLYDERVRKLVDFSVYLDLDDEVKVAWKIQRDMAERGHTLDNILASIEARKPDFERFVLPQREYADAILQVKPTELIPDDKERKVLKVRLMQREGVPGFTTAYLFDEGSTIVWTPCGRRLTCAYPGIRFRYGPEVFYGRDFSSIEVDGEFDKLEELVYIESHLSNIATKYYGELTQLMLAAQSAPGAKNGTALFQTVAALKIREIYEQLTGRKVDPMVRA